MQLIDYQINCIFNKWRRQDSNLRPLGYEPNELPTAPLRDFVPQR